MRYEVLVDVAAHSIRSVIVEADSARDAELAVFENWFTVYRRQAKLHTDSTDRINFVTAKELSE